ncbi:FAD binding domain-containing protein [Actinomadura madurae]|uniref:FAD binding domain-containing protein n=1 Tax=Actinomadura madurae TaxID=1993 RepID=UPI0020D1FCF4|nr:FAD binding domain-containing protein [Actinomadura madurae]MCP9984157.1 FAD binding domain-containing protein [Actinomadura madurae]
MKPPPFGYHAPATLAEALDALAAAPGGKVLAGGQSLIPLLNMRLAAPSDLVDINRVAGLDTVHVGDGGVRVGALARHARVERSAEAAAVQPLLGQALRHVAHPVIRNRGTVVGSLAHADPAAELPAVLAVLGGTVEAASARGRRTIPAAAFFRGPLEPGARTGRAGRRRVLPGRAAPHRHRVRRDGPAARRLRAVRRRRRRRPGRGPAGPRGPRRLPRHRGDAARARPGGAAGPGGDWAAAAAHVRERIDPEPDIHAGAAYRRHLTGVLTERALSAAAAEALRKAGD